LFFFKLEALCADTQNAEVAHGPLPPNSTICVAA
jgi:hypothetical protein